jgi:hypothetical protein
MQELKVYHPGTIWLGRLDETMYILGPAGSTESRSSEEYFGPTVCERLLQ